MKAVFNILVVALVMTAPQLGGCTRASSSSDGRGNIAPAQAQVPVDEGLVPVALPELGEVIFKNGSKSSGKVVEITPDKVSLQRNSTTSVPLSEVDRIVFSENALVYKTDGRQVIRGDGGGSAPIQQTWSDIPFTAFRLQDPKQGQAQIELGKSGVSKLDLKDIIDIGNGKTYVVDEIQFDLQKNTMTIKATPD